MYRARRLVPQVALAVTAPFLLAFVAVTRVPDWDSAHTHLHTLCEVLAASFALVAGGMAAIRFLARRRPSLLLLAVGLVGTALLDAYHAFVTSEWAAALIPIAADGLVPWTWTASRLYLAITMAAAVWCAQPRIARRGIDGAQVRRVVGGAALFLIGTVTFFALVPLPRAMFPGLVMGRPQELLAGVVFAFAFAIARGSGLRHLRHDPFSRMFLYSLVAGLTAQVGLMAHSDALFDDTFHAAHLVKILSYALVIAGLAMDSYVQLRRSTIQRRALESSNAALSEAIEQHRSTSDELGTAYAQLEGAFDRVERSTKRILAHERMAVIGRMARGIAHDFNNALTPIMACSDLLLRSADGPKDAKRRRRYIETISEASKQAAAAVSRLREFYRSDASDETLAEIDLEHVGPQGSRTRQATLARRGAAGRQLHRRRDRPRIGGDRLGPSRRTLRGDPEPAAQLSGRDRRRRSHLHPDGDRE